MDLHTQAFKLFQTQEALISNVRGMFAVIQNPDFTAREDLEILEGTAKTLSEDLSKSYQELYNLASKLIEENERRGYNVRK